MDWLISSTNKRLRLEDDVVLLFGIARLAEHLAQGNEVVGSDDLLLILRRFNQARSFRNEIITVMEDPKLSRQAIATAFERFVEATGGIDFPPEYRLLACNLGRLHDPLCRGLSGHLEWRVIDREPARVQQSFRDLKLDIGGQFRQRFTLSLDPELPDGMAPSAGAHVMGVGMDGNLEGTVSGGVPIKFGSLSFGASAASAFALEFFLTRRSNPVIGMVLGKFLATAPSPFDLDAMAAEIANRKLLGLRVQATGEVQFGAQVRVGQSLDLIKGVGSAVAGSLGFNLAESGTFELTVQAATSAASGHGGLALGSSVKAPIRVQVRRQRRSTRGTAVGIKVGVDTSSLFEIVKPQLLSRMQGIDALATQVGTLLPPSATMRGELVQRLKEQIDDQALRDLVARLLGQPGSRDLAELASERIAAEVDALEGLWVGGTRQAAAEVLRRMVSHPSLPVGVDERGELIRLLQPAVEQSIDLLHTKLREQIVGSVGSDPGGPELRALEDALNRVGQRVDMELTANTRHLDALVAAVGRALQGFQRSLMAMTEAVGWAQTIRFGAQLRSEVRRTRGRALDLTLDLDPGHLDAARLYQQVLTGSLEEAFESARDGSGAVVGLHGQLARFAGTEKRSGMDLFFLNLSVSAERIFNGEVEISTDTAGNLHVQGRGESNASLGAFGEKRSLSAINVFELAVAPETRRMTLGLTLSHRDQNLDPDEVLEFFSSLESSGMELLPRGTGQAGADRLRDVRATQADATRAGELRVWMDLNEAELLSLMQIREASAGLAGNRFAAKPIWSAAVDAIMDASAVSGSQVTLRNMDRLARRTDLGEDARAAIKALAGGRSRPGAVDFFSSDGTLLDRMQRVAKRAKGLVDLIRLMREIYFSAPNARSGRWDEQDYAERQERIDEILQFWFQSELEDNFSFSELLRRGELLNPKVRPHSLALLKTLKSLASGNAGEADFGSAAMDGGERAPLLASILVPGGDGTGRNGTEIALV